MDDDNVVDFQAYRKSKAKEEEPLEEISPLEDLNSIPTVVWALLETRKILEKYNNGDKLGAETYMLSLLESIVVDNLNPNDAYYYFRKICVLNDVMYDAEFWLMDLEIWEDWAADLERDAVWKEAFSAKTNEFEDILTKYNEEEVPKVIHQVACYMEAKGIDL